MARSPPPPPPPGRALDALPAEAPSWGKKTGGKDASGCCTGDGIRGQRAGGGRGAKDITDRLGAGCPKTVVITEGTVVKGPRPREEKDHLGRMDLSG